MIDVMIVLDIPVKPGTAWSQLMRNNLPAFLLPFRNFLLSPDMTFSAITRTVLLLSLHEIRQSGIRGSSGG
ncbi:hypothetical protein BZK42_21670 [Citrobacter braakii]|uniref:Uncharacterized protein n=1 Tax=Citrobacter braakii TaxID=57706 RepID=A0A1V8NUH1_CITBR|nr:hypothetical protein BZK42_21670 [Citrobacter braakii]